MHSYLSVRSLSEVKYPLSSSLLWLVPHLGAIQTLLTYLCPGRPCFSSLDKVFVLLGCLSFHQPPGLCLSCLFFFSSSDLAWFMLECLNGVGLLCMDTFSCIHGVGRWHCSGSLSAALCYVPIQDYSCSLRVFFYRTSAVGKGTY